MIRFGKTVIGEMLGANNKTAGWVEVLAMWGHESLPIWTLPLGEYPKKFLVAGWTIVEILHNTTTSWHTFVIDEFSSNFDSIRKTKLQKPFRKPTYPPCFCCLDWMTSLPLSPQLSQLFPAIFEFCNGGRSNNRTSRAHKDLKLGVVSI